MKKSEAKKVLKICRTYEKCLDGCPFWCTHETNCNAGYILGRDDSEKEDIEEIQQCPHTIKQLLIINKLKKL